MTTAAAAGPLTGVRVLEFATMLAAPYATTLLGDLGADVIKVESPRGDDSRHLGPERGGERGSFVGLNRNKRGIVLDLERAEAREAFARLVRTADILVTNTREPALSRLGLAYERVREHRPDIIWAGVTAFGPDGPYAGRPGIDFLAQGFAGVISLNGEPGTPPVRVTVPFVDVLTSVLVVTGALAALRERERSGRGQRIDVSLLDALMHAQAANLGSYFLTGWVAPRTGNRSAFFAPSGIYLARDGKHVCITCPSDKFFRNLSTALGADWPSDARFRNNAARLENQDALDGEIARRCAELGCDELLARLVEHDCLAAPVNDLPEAVRDPQVRHNGMIARTRHATLGELEVTSVPIHLQGTPGSVRLAPPVLGQHTEEVLRELGYDAGEIGALVRPPEREARRAGAGRAPR